MDDNNPYPTSPFDETKHIVTNDDRHDMMARAFMTDDYDVVRAASRVNDESIAVSRNHPTADNTATIKTIPFDAAAYIITEEDRADLLADAQSTNDPRVVEAALRVIERSRIVEQSRNNSLDNDSEPV